MIAAVRVQMARRQGAVVLASALVCLACASKWTVRATSAPVALQWPHRPLSPKVTFVESLTGFSPRKSPRTALKSLVYGGDRGEQSAFVLPVAVAKGGDGRIAVADLGRACVHLYIPEQQRYLRLTGGKDERIASPVAVTFDEASRLYVSDSAGRVVGFGPDGEIVLSLERAGADPLRRPTGLAYSPRKKLLYVVDTLANRIHAFGTAGDLAFSFGGRGEEAGQFNFPTHIFRSPEGELYVTDSLAFRIEIFDEQGQCLGSFGRHGDGSGDLALPKGVAVDRDGVVYVVDGLFDNVQLFNRRGDFLLTLGGRGVDFGEFWLPSGAFISEHDELYVCDTYNRRIQVFRITARYAETGS
jgi:DNA-binding beta-propeller fold protein YncE